MIGLPLLDCHAHIAPDVTSRQLARLGSAIIFAVTRSPAEATKVSSRLDRHVVWGCGLHPSFVAKGGDADLSTFLRQLHHFAFVGEVGLDRRSGHIERQTQVLAQVLEAVAGQPVLLSLHSNGCVDELLDLLEAHPHDGYVLHRFVGDELQLERALGLRCYFSVNIAMPDELLARIPLDRLLPETDYPALRRSKGGLPGDTQRLEANIARLLGLEILEVRRAWYRNLRKISLSTGAIDRMPRDLADLLVVV